MLDPETTVVIPPPMIAVGTYWGLKIVTLFVPEVTVTVPEPNIA